MSMRCPACHAFLELAETVPSALLGKHAYVTCPSSACHGDLVASFPSDVEKDPSLLTPTQAYESLRAETRRRSRRELQRIVVIVGAVVGGAALMVSCVACAQKDANPSAVWSSLVVVAVVTTAVLLLVRLGFLVDAHLGARRWMSTLPRAQLVFVRLPSTYRS